MTCPPLTLPPQVVDLLMGVFSAINEPDGIYAAAGLRPGGAAQLLLRQHEGDWLGTLRGHELGLSGGRCESRAAAHAGVASALHELGCSRAAATYLQACGAGGRGPAAAALQQQRCQLAWQLGQWQELHDGTGPTASASSGSSGAAVAAAAAAAGQAEGGGLDGVLLSCLQLLQQGRHEELGAAARAAQHGLVRQLATTSSGGASVAALNPLLVRLQMLEVLLGEGAAAGTSSRPAPLADLPQMLLLQRGGAGGQELAPGDFPLVGPLLQLRVAAAGAAGHRNALSLALQAQAAACRQAGRLTEAQAALQHLQVGCWWRMRRPPPRLPARAAAAVAAPGCRSAAEVEHCTSGAAAGDGGWRHARRQRMGGAAAAAGCGVAAGGCPTDVGPGAARSRAQAGRRAQGAHAADGGAAGGRWHRGLAQAVGCCPPLPAAQHRSTAALCRCCCSSSWPRKKGARCAFPPPLPSRCRPQPLQPGSVDRLQLASALQLCGTWMAHAQEAGRPAEVLAQLSGAVDAASDDAGRPLASRRACDVLHRCGVMGEKGGGGASGLGQ
jgi:hypothetical protein